MKDTVITTDEGSKSLTLLSLDEHMRISHAIGSCWKCNADMHPAGLNCALPQAEESILRQRDRFSHYNIGMREFCVNVLRECKQQKLV